MKQLRSHKVGVSHLEPLKISKSEASSQTLMLQMMSRFYEKQKETCEEQKQTNRLLRRMMGQDKKEVLPHERKEGSFNSPKGSNFSKSMIQSRLEDSKYRYEKQNYPPRDFESIDESLLIEKDNSFTQANRDQPPHTKASLNQSPIQTQLMTSQLKTIASTLIRIQKSVGIANAEHFHEKLASNRKSMVYHADKAKQEFMKFGSNRHIEEIILKEAKKSGEDNKNIIEKKKNYNILSQILPYSDRREIKIKIPFEQILMEYTAETINLKVLTEEWLGIVYRATASICWNMLSNHLLTFEEVKILFTENIIFNFIEYMQVIKDRGYAEQRLELAELINEISIKILDFLCKQYPLTKIDAPNIALRQLISPINDKGCSEYDLIGQLSSAAAKTGVSFTLKSHRNYTSDIMKCINQMIIKSNKEFAPFQKTMRNLFSEIFIPKDKRQAFKDGVQDKKDKKISPEEEVFYEQVKSYTKFIIGSKINKNTEVYSDHEIENGVFYVKSMSILRIITKWLEALQQTYLHPREYIKETTNEFKDHRGGYLYLYQQIKEELYNQIMENRKFLEEKIENIRKECYKMEVLLTEKEFTTDLSHFHLGPEQTSVGKYCTNLKSAISSYICSELNQVIHFLLEIPSKINVENIGLDGKYNQTLAKNDIKRLNLVHLRIFDLLRCKCVSKEIEIIYLLQRLYEKNKDPNDEFRIVRIKDRLNTSTRDIMINVQFNKGGLVCQIQLAVTSDSDKKQELLDQYSHFLYELQRAQLGSLSENASIWGTLEQKAIFFESLKKEDEVRVREKKLHSCVAKYQSEEHSDLSDSFENFLRPLICQSCKSFFEIPRTCLQNVQCKLCDKNFCGECHLSALSEVSEVLRKKFIFESNKFNHFLKYLQEYKDFNRSFPKKGYIIRKLYLKKELIFFNIVEKEVEKSDKISIESDEKLYRLEMTNTVLEGKRIVSKIINKEPIIAVMREGKFYLVQAQADDQKKELDNYFIFYLNDKKNDNIKLNVGSWSTILSKCQKSMKVMNLIQYPNYVSDLKFLKLTKKETEKINTNNESKLDDQQISYIINGARLILVEIMTDEGKLREGLQKKQNFSKLVHMVKKQITAVDMEFSKLTDQITEEKLLSEVKKAPLLHQFYYNIKMLNLNFCKVTNLQFMIKMENVQKVHLKANLLTSLEGVEKLIELSFIQFSENAISSLEPLRSLHNLIYIGAAKNQITTMKGIENLKKLDFLNLSRNLIQKIEYTQNFDLKELYISWNPIKVLEGIGHMKELRKLFTGNTPITNVCELQKLDPLSLENISFENVYLGKIPQVLNKFQNLQILDIENTGISILQNLSDLKKLKEIDLKSNSLTAINELENNPALEIIKLDSNSIENIEGIKTLVNLKKLYLKKNPLNKFSDRYQMEGEVSIYYTSSTEESQIIKATPNFEKIYIEWKQYRGTTSASSEEDD